MANDNISVYEPGQDISGRASAAITGKRFLKISGNRNNGNVAVAHADAAGRTCGVSGRDTASGKLVNVLRGKDRVTFVTAGANLTAFQEVEVGAGGVAVVKASGVAVGYAVTAATSGGDAEISLY